MRLSLATPEVLTSDLVSATTNAVGARLVDVFYWGWSPEEDYLAIPPPDLASDPANRFFAIELRFSNDMALVLRPWHGPERGFFCLRLDDTTDYAPLWVPTDANGSAVWKAAIDWPLLHADVCFFHDAEHLLPMAIHFHFEGLNSEPSIYSIGDDLFSGSQHREGIIPDLRISIPSH